MERALPPATLREKLPRFLQKCAQEFQDNSRYRDDPRYLRVWIQLVILCFSDLYVSISRYCFY